MFNFFGIGGVLTGIGISWIMIHIREPEGKLLLLIIIGSTLIQILLILNLIRRDS